MKSGNFQRPRDDKQGLTFWRGLPYSWSAFQSLKTVSGDLRLFFQMLIYSRLQFTYQIFGVVLQKDITEEDAAQLLAQGKEEGLDFFFHRYHTPLVYFALGLTHDEGTAEDIAADSFVKLWQHRTACTHPKAIKVYLYKTARNAAIDHLRHQATKLTHQKEVRYLNVVSEETILARRIETETHHQLYTALRALPPQCGKVFSMFYLEGKSYREIADELHLSIHTVRNQKVRALTLLRDRLTLGLALAVVAAMFGG